VKSKDVHYVCSQCGRSETKWLGRCPDCGSWNTFEEEAVKSVPDGKHACYHARFPSRLTGRVW
jgi:DNA repair protein RadA/Sms